MPIPTPNPGESNEDFMGRCMANETMVNEYEQDQRAAICGQAWRDSRSQEMHMETETRIYQPLEELRIVAEEGKPTRIEGLAVPYNQLSVDLGGFQERILPGAFAESLRSVSPQHDLRADIEHDGSKLLARASKGTLRFSEDQRGLWASIIAPGTTLGRDAVEDVRAGNLDGMSVSWLRAGVEDRYEKSDGTVIREVLKARLTGVTLTRSAAYRQTVDQLVLRSVELARADPAYDPKRDPVLLRMRLDLAAKMP